MTKREKDTDEKIDKTEARAEEKIEKTDKVDQVRTVAPRVRTDVADLLPAPVPAPEALQETISDLPITTPLLGVVPDDAVLPDDHKGSVGRPKLRDVLRDAHVV